MGFKHNEDSRVKIPALVHFTRIGYEYVSLKGYHGIIDGDTNIFVDTFREAVNRINRTNLSASDVHKILEEIKIVLSADDLGKAFYSMLLTGYNGLKLVDFDTTNGIGNTFQIVTELTYKNGNDEFRPDITVLINGSLYKHFAREEHSFEYFKIFMENNDIPRFMNLKIIG